MTSPGPTPQRPYRAARAAHGLLAALVGLALLLAGILVGAVPAAAQNGVGASTPAMINTVGASADIGAGQRLGKTVLQARFVVATGVAAEAGPSEVTTLYRAVGQHEADDIAAVSGYRNAPGLVGKYFFRTREQAEQYGQMMNKAPGFGAPNYLTSGSVPTRALASAEDMQAGSEGPGLFFRGDLTDFFNVSNHGLIP
jgi:hypothetical protein